MARPGESEKRTISTLDERQRREILDRVLQFVAEKSVPAPDTPDAARLRAEHEVEIVRSATAFDFERAMKGMLSRLGRHAGLFHGERPRSPSRIAFAATFMAADTPRDGSRYVFAQVHPGGPADRAGAKPGDIVLTVDGIDLVPPTEVPFALGHVYTLSLRRGSDTLTASVDVPDSQSKDRPLVIPEHAVTTSKLATDVGVLRVTMFPGNLGMTVAKDISRAVNELGTRYLIVDLRGNSGGGAGFLRLMSCLCCDRRGVGYTVGPEASRRGFDKNKLPALARIPESRFGVAKLVVSMALRDWRALRERSVALFTEGLGQQLYHGRIAMLVNAYSASAAEMVAAFAYEEGLATLVGEKTAGALGGARSWDVGYGYRVALPVLAYVTWKGTHYDGRGIPPHVEEPLSVEALWNGVDNQLARARAALEAAT
jgi:carboxyl-terminal processing protease